MFDVYDRHIQSNLLDAMMSHDTMKVRAVS